MKKLILTAMVLASASSAFADYRQVEPAQVPVYTEAASISARQMNLECSNGYTTGSYANRILDMTTVQVGLNGTQPLLILSGVSSDGKSRTLTIQTNSDRSQINGMRIEIYTAGRVVGGTLDNPTVSDGWNLTETVNCGTLM